jgi:rubredoxin/uncharacterized membrane protein
MKQWKCTVCGYIHKGAEPPDKCPVCGADKSLFALIDETADSPPVHEAGSSGVNGGPASAQKQRCSVCGYIHSGSVPPEQCPVCRADRVKFTPYDENTYEPSSSADPSGSRVEEETRNATRKKKVEPNPAIPQSALNRLALSSYGQKLTLWHGHPIAVHIPNGVLPMSVVFVLLAVLFKSSALAIAAQYNLAFVALSMPIVIATGLVDWVNGYKGKMTRVFRTKMICAGVVTTLSFILVVWGFVRPDIYTRALSENWFFLLVHIANLSAAIVAGWQGGKLVFRK